MDPGTAAAVGRLGAATLREACPDLETLADVLEISESRASRVWNEEDGQTGPAFLFGRMMIRMARDPDARPGALVAFARSLLAQSLMPLSDADLLARFWTLMKEETAAQGAGDLVQMAFLASGDLDELAARVMAHAGRAEELAGCAVECKRRRLDPRSVLAGVH